MGRTTLRIDDELLRRLRPGVDLIDRNAPMEVCPLFLRQSAARYGSATRSGVERSVVVPSPSCPEPLAPQQ